MMQFLCSYFEENASVWLCTESLGKETSSVHWWKSFLRFVIKYYGNSTIPDVPWVILISLFSPKVNLVYGLTASGEAYPSRKVSQCGPADGPLHQGCTLYLKWNVSDDLVCVCGCVCVHVRIHDSHACAFVRTTEVVRRGMKLGAVARRRSTMRRIHK